MENPETQATPSSRVLTGVRGIAGTLLGFVVYAFGLMGLVYWWFMRERDALSAFEHALNALGLALVAWVAAAIARKVAGGRGVPTLLGLVALVWVVGTANIAGGRAIEPAWFTVEEMIIGTCVIMTILIATVRADGDAR